MKLGADNVTVRRSTTGGVDAYGNDTVTTANLTISGCLITPRGSGGEDTAGRDQVITGVSLFAPATPQILATDTVELPDGFTYQVEGEPGRWSAGPIRFQQVALRRVTG